MNVADSVELFITLHGKQSRQRAIGEYQNSIAIFFPVSSQTFREHGKRRMAYMCADTSPGGRREQLGRNQRRCTGTQHFHEPAIVLLITLVIKTQGPVANNILAQYIISVEWAFSVGSECVTSLKHCEYSSEEAQLEAITAVARFSD
jgi:hypothetical protein